MITSMARTLLFDSKASLLNKNYYLSKYFSNKFFNIQRHFKLYNTSPLLILNPITCKVDCLVPPFMERPYLLVEQNWNTITTLIGKRHTHPPTKKRRVVTKRHITKKNSIVKVNEL